MISSHTIMIYRFDKELLGLSIINEHEESYISCLERKSNKTNIKKTGIATKAKQTDTRFYCDLCPADFTSISNLNTHKKAVHEGVK